MPRYFVRYRPRIFLFLMPMAFMTPISLYSLVIVKESETFRTTKERMIMQTERISTMKATIMSMT